MLRLTRDSVVYASGAVAGKAFGLLLLPILTRALTPDDYGRLDVLSTLGSALISALMLGLDTAVLRLAFAPGMRRPPLFATWYALATAIVAPVGLVVLLASPAISAALFGVTDEAPAVAVVGAVVVLGTYQVLALEILRAQRRPGAYAALSALSLAANAGLVILFVLRVGATAMMALLGLAGSLALASVLGAWLVGHELISRPDRSLVPRMLALGLPLAPAVILTWTAEIANRAILLGVGGATEVAYLAVALRFASVAGLAVTGFQLAWEPHAFAVGTDEAGRAQLADDARRALVGVAIAVVAIAAVAPELIPAASGAAYGPAVAALGLSLVAILGSALVTIAITPSALAATTGDIGIARGLGFGSAVAANLGLAPLIGAAGTAAALALGQIITAVVALIIGARRPPVRVAWTRVLAIAATAAVATLALTLPQSGAPPLVRALLIAAFGTLLVVEGSAREALAMVARR